MMVPGNGPLYIKARCALPATTAAAARCATNTRHDHLVRSDRDVAPQGRDAEGHEGGLEPPVMDGLNREIQIVGFVVREGWENGQTRGDGQATAA